MSVKINPTSEIIARLDLEPKGKVHAFFTGTCYEHMDKYVPKDTGALRENVTLDSDSITYESPYAHAQYIGIVNGGEVRNYTTPGTGPYWDNQMVSAEMSEVLKEVQNYVDKRS